VQSKTGFLCAQMCMTVLRARLAEREQELKRLRTLLAARENEFTQERKNLVAKLMASEQERRESEAALETNDVCVCVVCCVLCVVCLRRSLPLHRTCCCSGRARTKLLSARCLTKPVPA
jgi:hypothetical protein